jgi:hypothetical protein
MYYSFSGLKHISPSLEVLLNDVHSYRSLVAYNMDACAFWAAKMSTTQLHAISTAAFHAQMAAAYASSAVHVAHRIERDFPAEYTAQAQEAHDVMRAWLWLAASARPL